MTDAEIEREAEKVATEREMKTGFVVIVCYIAFVTLVLLFNLVNTNRTVQRIEQKVNQCQP